MINILFFNYIKKVKISNNHYTTYKKDIENIHRNINYAIKYSCYKFLCTYIHPSLNKLIFPK